MTTMASPVRDRSAARSLKVLQLFYGRDFARDFSVRLWDGTFVPAREHERFVFVVNTPYALRSAFRRPLDLNPGKAFVDRLIDIEGSVDAAIDAMIRAEAQLKPLAMARLFFALSGLPQPPVAGNNGVAHLAGVRHSRKRDAAAIGFHYDQPVEFYRAFLDSQLVYSCAYYDEGIETLEDAQRAKLDYLLRKLRLAPGERLLDIGCGFGALVIRAAQQGAEALGITLSRNQYEEAQRRIARVSSCATIAICEIKPLIKSSASAWSNTSDASACPSTSRRLSTRCDPEGSSSITALPITRPSGRVIARGGSSGRTSFPTAI